MEGWKNGRLEEWKVGRGEGWKMWRVVWVKGLSPILSELQRVQRARKGFGSVI